MEEILKKYRIDFNTPEEAVEISNILLNLGIAVYGPENIIDHIKKDHWDCFIYEDYDDGFEPAFTLAKIEYFTELESIDYKKFMDIIKNIKKYKKIENPKIDPYGEEDWGWSLDEKIITKFKKFESFNEIDPYGEEDWNVNDDLYVIYVIGQDGHFLTKKKERITDRRRGWKESYYVIATKRGRVFYFDGVAIVDNPYPARNIDKILSGEEMVGYIENFGRVRYDKLQNMCDILHVNIEDINMYEN